MVFDFTQEQEELRRTVRAFLQDVATEEQTRRLMETEAGHDPETWRTMAAMIGLQGLAIPQEYGGSGYSFLEQMLVFEEMGRVLFCAPYFSTVALAANLLLATGDEAAKKEYLPGLASGEVVATVALAEDSGRWDPDAVEIVAKPEGAGYRLTGHKMFVSDGCSAGLVLVAGRTPGAEGISLFALEGGAAGLTARPLETLDPTRKLARLEFRDAPAKLIGELGAGAPAVGRMLELAIVALAAEQVGGAARCLEMAVEYAKVRVQFGRPIGSFQAIKHKCADLLLELESARSAVYYAGWCAFEDSEELGLIAPLTKAYCSDAFFKAASENIQIHGAIGFTWDHPAHLYFRRAKSSQIFLGDPTHYRALLADRLGI